jgi:hypothetical protein
VLLYQNSGIDTGLDAPSLHADCAITDRKGNALAYRTCAAGVDMPLFFANSSNSWGRVKEQVYHRIMGEFGLDGVYQ